MAKLQNLKPRVEIDAVLTLNRDELGALDALVGYGVENVIEHFYKQMGKSYLQKYEHGLRSFLQAAAGASSALREAHDADLALQKHALEKGKAVQRAIDALEEAEPPSPKKA